MQAQAGLIRKISLKLMLSNARRINEENRAAQENQKTDFVTA